MNTREISLRLFNESGIENTPMNWHIWKRAFDLGVSSIKEDVNKWVSFDDEKPLLDETVRLSSQNSDDGDFGAIFYVSEDDLFFQIYY